MDEEITITMPRKDVAILFGAVIAANVATVFTLYGLKAVLTGVSKKATHMKESQDDPVLKEELVKEAHHFKIVDED